MPLKFSQTFHLMPTASQSFVVTNGEFGAVRVHAACPSPHPHKARCTLPLLVVPASPLSTLPPPCTLRMLADMFRLNYG